jgi:alpha-amylase
MKRITTLLLLSLVLFSNNTNAQKNKNITKMPFVWEGANLYFLMTDRFNNGDKTNDINFGRTKPTGKERGYQGGDIRGIIQKIDEGYFEKLGTNVIWMTPIVEQVKDGVDEGTGMSYSFHGYWTRDWSNLDPSCGSKKDLAELVTKAHAKGIRIMLDAVINHTGPVTSSDAIWPSNWVRTEPVCTYNNYQNNTLCALVKNLPDIKTEIDENVELPPFLIKKWKSEGRYEKEIASLDAFFKRTGYPKAPKYYIIKWLTDYILEFGIDGYRCDTVKHTNEDVWVAFKKECEFAFETWKKKNPKKVLDNNPFYTIAEVYGYGIGGGKIYDFSDKKVDYFEKGFNSMINFSFRWDADKDYETIFSGYSNNLNTTLKGNSVLNYLSSHDDGNPFDAKRVKPYETATKLLLTPGISQTYYGDESARSLVIEGTTGDATLRSFMNWNDIKTKPETQKIVLHWQKLGQFRRNHASVGAGIHNQISAQPYVFSRTFSKEKINDRVVVGLNLPLGKKEISVETIFENGTKLKDVYSGKTTSVVNGKASIDSQFDIVLLEKN